MTAVLAVFALFLIIRLALDARTNRDIGAEVSRLERETEDVEQKNAELSVLARHLSSGAFAEEEARTQLGLNAPGEHVVILRRGDATGTIPALVLSETISNPGRWFRYFFPP